jgi:drug/metabolite transporter (DMT)-like permease
MSQTAAPSLRAARGRAILFVLAAGLLFAGAAASVKALQGGVPLIQLVFFRSILALPVLAPLLWRAGGFAALATRRPMGHVWRGVFGLLGMLSAFYGFGVLPLATVTALGFTMPLFLTLLAAPLLGERVGLARGLAVAVGFVGVLLMVRPWADGGAALVPVLIVLGGALAWALAMITIRQLGAAGESGVTIVLWFSLGCSVVTFLACLPGWVWPTPGQWVLLVAIGVLSALAQLLMTEAYRAAETTLVAPFEYSGIVWTTLLGASIWAEAPDGWDALGILILVGCGLFIWHRETRRG